MYPSTVTQYRSPDVYAQIPWILLCIDDKNSSLKIKVIESAEAGLFFACLPDGERALALAPILIVLTTDSYCSLDYCKKVKEDCFKIISAPLCLCSYSFIFVLKSHCKTND